MVSKIMSKTGTILDVGSGYGFFLQAMLDKGFKNVVGLEVSEEKRKISKKITKAKVLNINLLEEKNSLLEKFDCITLFHVLEHIRDPICFLKNIKTKLKDEGLLVIEVPNYEDMLLSTSKEYRNFYWQVAHLSYFNEGVLRKIIDKSGFIVHSVAYVQRYGIENFMNWIVAGAPQIKNPTFSTEGDYAWLERYYKNYLCKIGRSDTIILIAKNCKNN
jgi:SAM-dependent methyltransferase